MKPSDRNLNLISDDHLFQTEESRLAAQQKMIVDIPLSELHSFINHPFKIKDYDAILETAESIKQYIILVPAIACPREEGGYELLSGHRRKRVSELAGKVTLPAIISYLDDDAATIIVVDGNIQRENILPSERAFVYKVEA